MKDIRPGPLLVMMVLAVLTQTVHSAVVSDTQIIFTGPANGNQFEATVYLTAPPVHNWTEMYFAYTNNTLVSVNWTVDAESDWYLVSPGDAFSASTIASQSFPIIFTIDKPRPPVPIPLGYFYLGVNTGRGFNYPVDWRNVFGWLELYNDGTTLTPIANAVDYGDGGIIVGSATPIPEPASLLLFAPALLLFRRRNRRDFASISDKK